MRAFMIVAATLSVVKGDLSSAGDLTYNCRVANEEVDRVLENSNFQMKKEGVDNMMVDYYGFNNKVNLYVWGWKLPLTVSLSVASGNLTGMNTLKRSTDSTDCSNVVTRTLEGIFEYGPELSMKYDTATAKFLYWEVQGKYIFKPKPRMHVALLNGTFDCRFESIRTENSGQSEHVFETDNSWKGWLISKLLVRGLQQQGDTDLKHQMDLWSQGEIANYFTGAWCSLGPYSKTRA